MTADDDRIDDPVGAEPIGSDPAGLDRAVQEAADDVQAHREALRVILRRNGVSLEALWLRYFSVGGEAGPVEIEAYVGGMMSLSVAQRDMLAYAANEYLDEMAGRLRVPYSRPLRDPLPAEGPLTALVNLMQLTPRILSGDLASAVTAAGRALGPGVGLTVYLVDASQQVLVPFLAESDRVGNPREPISVDGSLPGRAFATGEIQVSHAPEQARLWVPLLDGLDRLGVLDVMVPAHAVNDPLLREQCGWFANLLAHLVSAARDTGDAVLVTKRRSPATASAELIFALLPPATAGNESFTVSCMLEPADAVGGDAFDYALSSTTVHVTMLDAMGHSVGSSLIAAAALSAARAARRQGHGLAGQAEAIDASLSAHFPEAFATGVLGELDLTTGRLRYISAGHPPALVLREGRVVSSLDGGRRVPFGLGDGTVEIAETYLQPADWLVLYTDGVTEARDPEGGFFGYERLVDFLEVAAATRQQPAETVRRLIGRLLAHQNGLLQDDASVLLASWQPPPGHIPPA